MARGGNELDWASVMQTSGTIVCTYCNGNVDEAEALTGDQQTVGDNVRLPVIGLRRHHASRINISISTIESACIPKVK